MGFPLAFVSVFTIAFFGWFFATTRGYRRFLGVPVVLVALVILFMWAYDRLLGRGGGQGSQPRDRGSDRGAERRSRGRHAARRSRPLLRDQLRAPV
jgi:hypothetical protein